MFKKVLAIILTLCFAGMTAGGCGNKQYNASHFHFSVKY